MSTHRKNMFIRCCTFKVLINNEKSFLISTHERFSSEKHLYYVIDHSYYIAHFYSGGV
jgi:hypothetical protein